MNRKMIYLDNAATTSVYKEVVNEMEHYLIKEYGNPGSPHTLGEKAMREINGARKRLSFEIGAKSHEIIFTSGGTEANNSALLGIFSDKKKKNKIIISSIEHSSIYEPAQYLKSLGYDLRIIPVNKEGLINLTILEKAIDDITLMVSVIHVNNEIGVMQNIKEIGKICKKKEVLFHTDAVQSFGKERINVKELGVDLLSTSAHKIGGPKGSGFLYVKEGIDIKPLILGGSQESGRRGGTENVPGIMGFVKALEIAKKIDKENIRKLKDYLILKLEKIGGKINGSKENRIYDSVNINLKEIDAEKLVLHLSQKGIMCSTRSACLTKQKKENRVLKALGLSELEMESSMRLVLNEYITRKDIDYVVREIERFLRK